jgi:hypothetical protein
MGGANAGSDLRAFTVLCRLRRVETDEARRDLGEALTQETELAARDEAIGREIGEARQIQGEFDRDAFSAWFGRMRAERARLADATLKAEARTAAARSELANRRVAQTAAEEALGTAVAARDADVARRDQLMLEDVARALRRAAETGRASD